MVHIKSQFVVCGAAMATNLSARGRAPTICHLKALMSSIARPRMMVCGIGASKTVVLIVPLGSQVLILSPTNDAKKEAVIKLRGVSSCLWVPLRCCFAFFAVYPLLGVLSEVDIGGDD